MFSAVLTKGIDYIVIAHPITTSLTCLFRKKTTEIAIQSPRSVEQSSNNADVSLITIFRQPYSSSNSNNHMYTYSDAPPSYSEVSKTVQKLPPPYPGT